MASMSKTEDPIRTAMRRAEDALFFLLDHIFNNGDAYRAAKRNADKAEHRRRAQVRLEDWRRRRRASNVGGAA
jgi:hypothetical protein